jgi:hypothetical protein
MGVIAGHFGVFALGGLAIRATSRKPGDNPQA